MEDLINIKIKSRKTKRGLQILDNLYHFCFNIATDKLKHLYTNDRNLKAQIEKLKNVFVSDHEVLTRITTELNIYTTIIENKLSLLKNYFNQFVKEKKHNALLEQNNLQNSIQGIQELIYKRMTIILKITNYEKNQI